MITELLLYLPFYGLHRSLAAGLSSEGRGNGTVVRVVGSCRRDQSLYVEVQVVNLIIPSCMRFTFEPKTTFCQCWDLNSRPPY